MQEINLCLNCYAECKGKFCDELCKYGYSVIQYRKMNDGNKE